jgi:MFS family permease
LVGLTTDHAGGFMAAAALFAASLIPVCATRRTQPGPPSTEPFGVMDLWRAAPAAVIAAFAAGAVNGAVLQLHALYASAMGPRDLSAAAAFNAALAIGALVSQGPAGWISDRYDRRIVIAWLAAFASATALVLALLAPTLPWIATLLLTTLWGAGAMSFYGVAVAHGADRAGPGQAAGMIAGVLVVWAVGALIGPPLAGAAMASALGPQALFLYAAFVLAGLAVAMLLRRADKRAPTPDEKTPFSVAPVTTPAAAALDPRIEALPASTADALS